VKTFETEKGPGLPPRKNICRSPIKPVAEIPYDFHFKRISIANVLEHDEHPSYPSGLRGEKWVQACLKPRLAASVPDEISFLFNIARGSMVYAMFFLPLASLAAEQSFRVLEAGARVRCKQLGLVKKKSGKTKALPDESFADVVAKLKRVGQIPDDDSDLWKSMVFLRNRFSHHTSQTIRARHNAVEQLAFVAELLNRLFSSEHTSTKKHIKVAVPRRTAH
jgi:hypothetical protein